MKLSYSSTQKYLLCGEKWRLHYQERIRSTRVGSALFFGGAIDEALNRLLLEKKKELTDGERLLMQATPEETFISSLSNVYLNGEYIQVKNSPQVDYYKSDCDVSLLEEQDLNDLFTYFDTLEEVQEFVNNYQKIKNPDDLQEQIVYNTICWLSLMRKGLMLIDAYRKEVLPQLEEVISIQEQVSLPDGEDEFIGVIDFVGRFKEDPENVYIVDNKTSSRPYPEDSVRTSEQLAIYAEYKEVQHAAYIVVEKKIRKRTPRTRIQIVKDKVNSEQLDKTFDELTEVFHGIKEERFDKNPESCYAFGRPCEYYDICHKGLYNNVVKLEKK